MLGKHDIIRYIIICYPCPLVCMKTLLCSALRHYRYRDSCALDRQLWLRSVNMHVDIPVMQGHYKVAASFAHCYFIDRKCQWSWAHLSPAQGHWMKYAVECYMYHLLCMYEANNMNHFQDIRWSIQSPMYDISLVGNNWMIINVNFRFNEISHTYLPRKVTILLSHMRHSLETEGATFYLLQLNLKLETHWKYILLCIPNRLQDVLCVPNNSAVVSFCNESADWRLLRPGE